LPKKVNENSKYFKKNSSSIQKKSYAQVSSNSTNTARKMLKIKEAFPNFQNKKIELIQKIISSKGKLKPHINMTTKRPSCKQVIVLMSTNNANKFVKDSSVHIANINRTLKNIKSDVIADFICIKNKDVVISTNKVASSLDLQSIEKYVKNAQCIDTEQMESLRLFQSKLYLKIISILYLSEHTNSCITSNNIENILKNNHIFNDIVLVSKPRVIKVFSKLNMAIIWTNIWNTQSGLKARSLINKIFNIESFITTICGANMNSGVPQCKNCWKWGHIAGVCRIQGVKYVKYNSSHQTIHHCQFVWCCKANEKTNPPRLETKQEEPCLYSFKCPNCKGEHQADSTDCSFWKHRFNKE